MDQTQTSDDAPLLTHSTPQSGQTTLLAQQKPLVTIVHASVGSGHKAAANAIAQAFDHIRGTNGIPEDVEIEVLDILNFWTHKIRRQQNGRLVYRRHAPNL